VVAANEWVSPYPKPAALSELADAVLDPAVTPSPVAMALLRREHCPVIWCRARVATSSPPPRLCLSFAGA
jgi:hypothetical protein